MGDGLVDVLAVPLILAAAVDAGRGLQGADVHVALPAMAQGPEQLGQIAAGGVVVRGGHLGDRIFAGEVRLDLLQDLGRGPVFQLIFNCHGSLPPNRY